MLKTTTFKSQSLLYESVMRGTTGRIVDLVVHLNHSQLHYTVCNQYCD